RYEGGNGHLRSRHRARLRAKDRRRHACRSAARPARHRGLPRPRGRHCGGAIGNSMTSPSPAVAAPSTQTVAALELRNVHTYYGHIHAIKGVSLRVMPNEIVTLIGANGAGKTTTLRTISGIQHAREGEV